MKSLTFSTGNMYKHMDVGDIDKTIDFLKSLDLRIDGYNLSLIQPDRLELSISEQTLNHIKSMRFNSIHGPVTEYSNNEKTKQMLDRLKQIYDQINAQQIVFHPAKIKDYSLLKNSGMNCLIELLSPRHDDNIDYYENILTKYPWLDFCHDISHAGTVSMPRIKEFFEKFKKRTTQIHISYGDNNHWHAPMFKASKEFLAAAECVKEFDGEIVIESEMHEPEIIKKEVAFCRKWLETN
ncbi:hypothetical protein ACFL96_19270 [Thermoproteota archaeon]